MLIQVLFHVFALILVLAALGVIIARNPVYSALALVMCFITSAAIWLLIEAEFLAVVLVLVYVGAVMVLFLFVVMLLGTELLPVSKALPWQRPLAFVLAALLVGEAAYLLFARGAAAAGISQPVPADFGSPQGVGQALFTSYLLPFEITSVLLLIAMVGAIVLTVREKGK